MYEGAAPAVNPNPQERQGSDDAQYEEREADQASDQPSTGGEGYGGEIR
jgi:hypothetical protein